LFLAITDVRKSKNLGEEFDIKYRVEEDNRLTLYLTDL